MSNKFDEKGPHFWLAVGMIAVGFLFLLDNFRILDIGDVWHLWPVVLIVIGVTKLRRGTPQEKNSGYTFIGFGVFFLLWTLDVFDLHDIWQLWPIILILLGLSMIYRRSRLMGDANDRGQEHSEDRLDVVAVFGGHQKNVTSKNFQGGHVTAIFGGAELYFDHAELAEGENVLDLLNIFGGTEIHVPKQWNIRFTGIPIFGGFEDKRREVPAEERHEDRSLTIKGLVLFGGLVIKSV